MARAPVVASLATLALLALGLVVWFLEGGGAAGPGDEAERSGAPLVTAPRGDGAAMALPDAPAPAAAEMLVPEGAVLGAPGKAPMAARGEGAGALELPLVVWDRDGDPVPGAEVELLDAAGERRLGAVMRTDDEGRCRVLLPDDSVLVHAWSEDVGSSGHFPAAPLLSLASMLGEAPMKLLPYAQLDVVVEQQDGTPAPGAEVWVREVMSELRLGPVAPRRTDGNGRVTLDVLADLMLVVEARWGPHEAKPLITHADADSKREERMRLRGPWRVQGVVLDAQGEPLPSARVTLWRELPGGDLDRGVLPSGEPHRDSVGSDAEGRYLLHPPGAGSWLVQAARAGHAPGEVYGVTLSDHAPVAELTLVLPVAARIAGVLVDGSGEPLPGVKVHARPAHHLDAAAQDYGPTPFARLGQGEDVTDEQGRFDIGGLHPSGRFIVWCRPDERARDRKLVLTDIPAGMDDLRLVASEQALARGVLEVSVQREGGGLPLPMDKLQIWMVIRMDGRVIDTNSMPAREPGALLRFEGLAPGFDYALRVNAPGCGAVELPWFTARPGLQRLAVSLPPECELLLRVLDGEGRPQPGVELELTRHADVLPVEGARRRRSNALGEVRWRGLDPARYALSAAGQAGQAELQLQLHAGATLTEDVVLKP